MEKDRVKIIFDALQEGCEFYLDDGFKFEENKDYYKPKSPEALHNDIILVLQSYGFNAEYKYKTPYPQNAP
jgi:hypothetical protein